MPRSPQPSNVPTPSSTQLMPIDARFPPPMLPPIGTQSLPNAPIFPLRTGTQPSMFDDSLNQSLYKVKQLESRLQMTEISNRALLEEVVRLQTEVFNAIRQSQTILQEERLSRQQIENNVRIQNDVILQLTARIKRNEDAFNDEYQSTLSVNTSVRGLEQQIAAIQREHFVRRDTQSISVEGIRKQLGETSIQREQLEKIQLNLVEELRSIRNRLEIDSSNFNALTNEVRHRTRKLEDDHRLTSDLVRKQQETINAGDLLFNSFRTAYDQKMNEYRDLFNEIKSRLDFEREDRRLVEAQLTSRLNDAQSTINSTRSTQTEIVKTMENMRRESISQIEQTHVRLRQEMSDMNNQMIQRTIDKLDRLRDEMEYKTKENEKNHQLENEQRQRQLQSMQSDFEQQIETLKSIMNEEQGRIYNEIRETTRKSAESLRKLNDGITLIEQQTDENRRKIEKVLDAEIKSRKQQYKELADTITKADEKSNYQIGTIQSSISNINTRLAELRDLSNKPEIININRRLDTIEHTHRESNGNIQTLTNHLADLSSRHTANDTRLRQTEDKIKEDEQTVRDLAARIALLPTTEDVVSVRRDLNDKIRNDLQKGMQQHEENLSQALVKHEQRINNVRVDLNVLEEQINQRMTQNDQQLANQIRDKHADQDMWRREVDQKMARLMNLRDTLPQEIYNLNEKISAIRQECMKFSQEENFRTKDEIERLRKDFGHVQRSIAAPSPTRTVKQQDVDYRPPPLPRPASNNEMDPDAPDEYILTVDIFGFYFIEILINMKTTNKQRIINILCWYIG
ncbi:unnamed protein product [Rotaria sordida]|uniref:Uncharacterized protein n=1 Tax=Rotaria sordida TaxID=392033 RepID=A0A813PTI9_9BILA|nr:unnamed protein product [Rotaria sordida]CAF0757548.1 unnamed protein product [Rotaria sordida]